MTTVSKIFEAIHEERLNARPIVCEIWVGLVGGVWTIERLNVVLDIN